MPTALRGALNELVRRHEVLRTRFGMQDGQPVQVIAPELHDGAGDRGPAGVRAGRARATEARRRAQAEAAAPFDLARGPLIRARLLRLAPSEHWLLLTLHHIVTDGWSSGVLTRELTALYGAFRRGEPSPLPALPVQYADYRAVAAGVAAGSGARTAAGVLAAGAGRFADPGPAHGSAAPGAGELSGRMRPVRSPGAADAVAQGAQPARGGDAVHDAARRLPDPALSLQRAGGHRGRRADRRAHPAATRGVDRILREHARAARRPVGRARASRQYLRAGAGPGARRLCAPGPAVREAGGGTGAEARSVAQSVVPGVARVLQNTPARTLAVARPRRAAARRDPTPAARSSIWP